MKELSAVQVGAQLLQEGMAFDQPALREQHVRQRVVRPGLLAPHGHGLPRGCFGLLEKMALLPGKGKHAVQEGDVGRGRQRRERHAQHAGRVAAIEQVVVAQLERSQVAREGARLLLVQRDRARDVAVYPGRDRGDEALLTRRGARGTGEGACR